MGTPLKPLVEVSQVTSVLLWLPVDAKGDPSVFLGLGGNGKREMVAGGGTPPI